MVFTIHSMTSNTESKADRGATSMVILGQADSSGQTESYEQVES